MVASAHAVDAEQSTRRRILAATFVVLARDGRRRLQLSDVAAQAKVSRPTLYRYFGSKEGLLEAFGLYEQDNFDAGIATAISGLSGADRLDAALRFIVDFQSTYSLSSLAETEPEHVLQQMKRVLPIMRDRIARIIGGEQAEIAASSRGTDRRVPLRDRRRHPGPVSRRVASCRRAQPRRHGSLVVQPVVDLRGDQLRLLEMQEMTDAVDDLESRSVSRKVRAEVAEQFSTDRSVVGAVQIQRRHRRRLHRGCRFGFRVRVGELRIERGPIRRNDIRDVIGGHVAP